MKSKVNIIEVKRLKRGGMLFFEQSIKTNGVDFIEVKYEDKDVGFSHIFNKSMCKEFFRKLKNQLKTK